MSSTNKDEEGQLPYPVVSAETIEKSMKDSGHWLTPEAVRNSACMSDMAGMSGLGVHKIKLGPGIESTTIHYHLLDSEWLYILSGSAVLLLVNASTDLISLSPSTSSDPSPTSGEDANPKFEVEEVIVKAGDFMGFQGGTGAARWAHGLRGGEEGVEYICGGTRERLDICNYPLKGVTRIHNKLAKKVANVSSSAFTA